MKAYLKVLNYSETNLPEEIPLNKAYTTIGTGKQYDVPISKNMTSGYVCIRYDKNEIYLEVTNLVVQVNNSIVKKRFYLKDGDTVSLDQKYSFAFIYKREAKKDEFDPKHTKTSKLLAPTDYRLKPSTSFLARMKREASEDKVKTSEPLPNFEEAEMTLMWSENSLEKSKQFTPELISPSTGKIISMEKEKIIVGRSISCDLPLFDDYVSREHLEFSKNLLGFILKNVGKNEVIVEKKGHNPLDDGRIMLEERGLKPGESTLLSQEATIILGNQIIYYFNTKKDAKLHLETSSRNRKYNFYKELSSQKEELIDAAKIQKVSTPRYRKFEKLQAEFWFKYFAINDLSGDFFLYHEAEDKTFFCMGDVSGHGATAALLASQISGMFKILAEMDLSPVEIINSINKQLLKSEKTEQNLYALVNVFIVDAEKIDFCIAGNSVPPLYYIAKKKELVSMNTPSTPIGLLKNEHFNIYSGALNFQSGDMLIMFTDGVTEAEMINGGQIEYHRVQTQIQKQIDENVSMPDFLNEILNWLEMNSEIEDDLSIILLTRNEDQSRA